MAQAERDLGLVAVLRHADEPFAMRGRSWPIEELPVPAELLVYTAAEWEALADADTRFARVLRTDLVWLVPPWSDSSATSGRGS